MHIKSLELKNFRCFDSKILSFDNNITCILGNNGTGKTSLLEALHYACYFKSFKASSSRELVKIGAPGFNIKINLHDSNLEQIDLLAVNFSDGIKNIKLNNNSVKSFKEHFEHYTTITLTEDDLELIKGSPEVRRAFVDQILILDDPQYSVLLKKLKKILLNRNALLEANKNSRNSNSSSINSMYELWTKQLWDISQEIRAARIDILSKIELEFNELISSVLSQDFSISFKYNLEKYLNFNLFFEDLLKTKSSREFAAGRSLFGAHLDDFSIIFMQKSSRIYASRGQQKLIVLFIRLSQLKMVSKNYAKTVFLLDDFITDFDDQIIKKVTPLLQSLASQLIFTMPSAKNLMGSSLGSLNMQIINL